MRFPVCSWTRARFFCIIKSKLRLETTEHTRETSIRSASRTPTLVTAFFIPTQWLINVHNLGCVPAALHRLSSLISQSEDDFCGECVWFAPTWRAPSTLEVSVLALFKWIENPQRDQMPESYLSCRSIQNERERERNLRKDCICATKRENKGDLRPKIN